jgi:hypothetical protein
MNEIVGTHNKGFSDDLAISEGNLKSALISIRGKSWGEGGFAKVYKAYDKRLDEYVASSSNMLITSTSMISYRR